MLKSYIVVVDQPDGVTDERMAKYIEDAVAEMKGCYSPDDDLYHLDGDSVVCKRREVGQHA